MSTEFDIKKRAMIEALEKSLGIVTTAAKTVGIDRTTHYKWLEKDAEYKAAVDAINDMVLDFGESKLHECIKNDDTTAIIFFLKTKGKKRGYVERMEQEISGPGGGHIVLKLDDGCSAIKTDTGNPSI